MGKKEKIEELNKKISKCKKCKLHKTRINTVPGEGPASSKIMFIGEAPGRMEDETGKPFIGRSGKLLTKLMEENGVQRNKVFVTSILRCRPPENRNPQKDEVESCIVHLNGFIDIIKPKLIILLGLVSAKTLLGVKSLKETGDGFITRDGINYFVTCHPSAGLRFKKYKIKLGKDLKTVSKFL